ncbi:MAG: glutamine amidotransferase [Leptolyngbyaceae cyanobacterium CRU_2_3]|nr:glutamine amidotransferase [Leptolyngbyaceae cyanobacterium CRU_2_3]
MKKILLVVHQETSDPGLVGQILQENGYQLDVCCPASGAALPSTLDSHAGVVVFGGPMSANDDATLPFIRAELDWIAIVLDAGKPYLGICLGAQLLARVLGAKVSPHPRELREIGYVPIQPSPVANNPLAELTHVYHWHKEGFEIPAGATLLATGQVFANQAFRYGEMAYGTQFHPEMSRALIDKWVAKVPEQLNLPGAQPYEAHVAEHDRHAATVDQWLRRFLIQQWLGVKALAA